MGKKLLSTSWFIVSLLGFSFALFFIVLLLKKYAGMSQCAPSDTTCVLSDSGIVTAYILAFITLIAVIIFFVVDLFKDPKQAVKTVGMIVGIGIVIGIGAALGGGDASAIELKEGVEFSGGQISFMSGGIIATYILAGLGIIGIVISEVLNFFR